MCHLLFKLLYCTSMINIIMLKHWMVATQIICVIFTQKLGKMNPCWPAYFSDELVQHGLTTNVGRTSFRWLPWGQTVSPATTRQSTGGATTLVGDAMDSGDPWMLWTKLVMHLYIFTWKLHKFAMNLKLWTHMYGYFTVDSCCCSHCFVVFFRVFFLGF